MPFKLSQQQCVLLVAALIVFIVYLWGKKPTVGGSLISSDGNFKGDPFFVITDDVVNAMSKFGVHSFWKSLGWSREVGMLAVIPNGGVNTELLIKLFDGYATASLGGHPIGKLYASPHGIVRGEDKKGPYDTLLHLKEDRTYKKEGYRNYYTLQDVASGKHVGVTNKYLYRSYDTRNDPISLMLGDPKDPNFAALHTRHSFHSAWAH